MRRLRLPLIAVLSPLLAILAVAQLSTQQTTAETIAALREEAPDVQFFHDGGKVSRVYGVKFATGANPLDTAETFMSRYGAIFEPGDSSFQVDGTQDIMNGKFTAVYFKQT